MVMHAFITIDVSHFLLFESLWLDRGASPDFAIVMVPIVSIQQLLTKTL